MMRTLSLPLAGTILRSGRVESAWQTAWHQVQCGVGGPPAWDCPVPCRAVQTPQPMSPMSSGSATSSDQGRRTDDSPVRTGELLWAFKEAEGSEATACKPGHTSGPPPHRARSLLASCS